MAHLTDLPNIGSEMARKLRSVGIDHAETLAEVGAKTAFLRLKEKYPQVCLVHLYALEGALQNKEFGSLSEATKADLKAFSDSLKQSKEKPGASELSGSPQCAHADGTVSHEKNA